VFLAVLSITFSVPAAVLAAPGQPTFTYPTYNELLYPPLSPIDFQWTSSGTLGTIYYDFEVSTDGTFTNTADIVDSNDGSHSASGCLNPLNTVTNKTSSYAYQPTTTYYFRVQAYDSTCNGDFTTGGSGWRVYVFRTAIPAPTLTAPGNTTTLENNLNNDDTNNPPELFQWSGVSEASGYLLQVSSNSSFGSLYLNTYTASTQNWYTPSSDLPGNTHFFWRVETLNSTYGPSSWSSTCSGGPCSFYTGNTSAAPVPLSIAQKNVYKTANGKVTNDFTPGLRWQEVALPAGATFSTYEVEASTDSTFYDANQTCFDVTSAKSQVSYLSQQVSTYAPDLTTMQVDTGQALVYYAADSCPVSGGEFTPATKYYWRVRAWFNGSTVASDWSSVFSFYTSYPKVVAGFTAVPHAGGNTILFSWTDVSPLPNRYGITICRDPNFSEGDCYSTPKSGGNPYNWSIPLKVNLPTGTTLYWRVRAEGNFGPGLWSDTQTVLSP